MPTHPSNISKVSLCHYTYTLDGSWGGRWVVMGWWLKGSWGGWWWGSVGGVGMGCWRVHGVGAYTHPPMNSYNVKIFNIMNTNPPTHQTYPKCHSHYTYILDGSWGGWWIVVGCLEGSWGGWLEDSWGGLVCDGVGGSGVGGWRVHGMGGYVMLWVVVGWVV